MILTFYFLCLHCSSVEAPSDVESLPELDEIQEYVSEPSLSQGEDEYREEADSSDEEGHVNSSDEWNSEASSRDESDDSASEDNSNVDDKDSDNDRSLKKYLYEFSASNDT